MKQPWDIIRGTHVKQDKYRRKKANPPHLWECCGVTPAPGCGRRCREPGARCRGPCTRWSLFLGGRSVAGLWELWQLRRDQSRTWAGPSHPAVLQSQTEYNTTRKQHYQPVWRKQQQQKQHGNLQKLPYIKATEMSEANLVQWRVAVVGLAAWMLLENWVDTRNWGLEFMMRISNVNPESKGKEECLFSAASPFSTRRVPQQLAQKLDMLLIAWAHFTTQVFSGADYYFICLNLFVLLSLPL